MPTKICVQPVAVVTGCGRLAGIGAAIARSLSVAGYVVVATEIDAAEGGTMELDDLVTSIKVEGGKAASLTCDVTDDAQIADLSEYVQADYGRWDVLVNNAAAGWGEDRNDIEDTPVPAFNRQVDVSLSGTFRMSKAAVPLMRAQGAGSIINIVSLGAVLGVHHRAAYSAAKAGISGLTRALAVDLASHGIRVNAVCPGLVLTPRNDGTEDANGSENPFDQARNLYGGAPLGRPGTPVDIANAVEFLVSEKASYVTGQVLTVDGGMGIYLRPMA